MPNSTAGAGTGAAGGAAAGSAGGPTGSIIGAAIGAAAGLGSAYMQSRSARAATRSQAKAGMNALGHELRTEKRQSQVLEREWEDYQQRRREWRDRNFPQGVTGPGGRAPNTQPRQQASAAPGPMPAAPGAMTGADMGTLGALMGLQRSPLVPGGVPAAGTTPERSRTMGDWGDWEQYGV